MPKATTLILPPGRSSIGKPESWPLPPDAARVLARVAPSSIPVLCVATGGTAFTRIATSVHRASGRRQLVRVALGREGAGGIVGLPRGTAASHLTLALDGLEALDLDGQDALAAYLDASAPRLVCATRALPEELASAWRAELLEQLGTVTIRAPALRERRDEIPRLAAERIAMLCDELGIDGRPALGERAAAALAAHDWPGDVTEFDAVLLSVLLAENLPATIEPTDLVWPARAVARPPPAPDGAASDPFSGRADPHAGLVAPAARAEPLDSLEAVAVELAHQLKNPLVTVKTFVANMSRMDEEERTAFRDIALEGIERIDAPLEQILAFSRLAGSTDETLEVAGALSQCLRDVGTKLDEKGIQVQGIPPTRLAIRGAAGNLQFALGTLGRHVADTIEPHSTLAISRPAADQIVLRYRESGASTYLRDAVGDPDSCFPLALLLVRGALIRMGGGLRSSHAQDEVTVELSFTPA